MNRWLVIPILACTPWCRATTPPADTANTPIVSIERFRAFGDNLALVNQMKNNHWSGDDDRALRARYGFRYDLSGRPPMELFFSYTGSFDFYWWLHNTRDSGPVINRLSNPALHLRYHENDGGGWFAGASVEHESNGQVQDVDAPQGAAQARAAYAGRDRAFFDTVSRGADFLAIEGHVDDGRFGLPLALDLKARVYLDQDYRVTWGPLARSNVRLSDYNRIAMKVEKAFPFGTVEATWTVGDRGVGASSQDLAYQLPDGCNRLPVVLWYHHGPLNTLSNYTQRQDSWGIGLRFYREGQPNLPCARSTK
jgi:hypothetical protein